MYFSQMHLNTLYIVTKFHTPILPAPTPDQHLDSDSDSSCQKIDDSDSGSSCQKIDDSDSGSDSSYFDPDSDSGSYAS